MIFCRLIFLLATLLWGASAIYAADNSLVGCVNGAPIYLNDYNRLMKSQVAKFERRLLFDPWQASTLDALDERNKLIKLARQKNILLQPNDALFYKNLFAQKAKELGSPVNTYDLNSYAEENALLLQAFAQEQSKGIQDNLIQKELLAQEARNRGLNVQNWEVETRLQEVRSKYKLEDDYHQFLRKNNSTEIELKMQIEEQLLADKMRLALSEGEANNQDTLSTLQIGTMSSLNNADQFQQWLKKTKQVSQIEFSLPGSGVSVASCKLHTGNNLTAELPQPKTSEQNFNEASPEKKTFLRRTAVISKLEAKDDTKNKKGLLGFKKWFSTGQ
jgi:hypothetical protein